MDFLSAVDQTADLDMGANPLGEENRVTDHGPYFGRAYCSKVEIEIRNWKFLDPSYRKVMAA